MFILKELDTTLCFIRDKTTFNLTDHGKELNTKLTQIRGGIFENVEVVGYTAADETDIASFVEKLQEDGYVTRIGGKEYKISINGLVFLADTALWWKGRPYQHKRTKETRSSIFNIVKIIAIVLNALAILFLTYKQAFPDSHLGAKEAPGKAVPGVVSPSYPK